MRWSSASFVLCSLIACSSSPPPAAQEGQTKTRSDGTATDKEEIERRRAADQRRSASIEKVNEAVEAFEQGKVSDAERLVEEAIKTDPSHAAAH